MPRNNLLLHENNHIFLSSQTIILKLFFIGIILNVINIIIIQKLDDTC